MKIKFVLSLLFFAAMLSAQSGNPFDIPGKDTSSREAPVISSQEGITQAQHDTLFNPFEKRTTPTLIESPREKSRTSLIGKSSGLERDTSILVLVYSLIMLVVLTLAISMDKARFTSMMKSSINSNYLKTLFRDSRSLTNGQGIILYLFFLLNAGFALWLILLKLNSPWSFNLMVMVGIVTGFYVIRHLVMYALSIIYNLSVEVAIHNYSIGLHNMILGVFILPVILAIEFLPGVEYTTFLYVLIGLFLMLYVLRQLKGLLSCFAIRGFNPFYFFIYLCAIEIAPVLVVYKMMIGAL